MLRGLSPLLAGEVLHILDDMGHGDVLGVVDRNFPAHSHGQRVVDLPGTSAVDVWRAILTVTPLDAFQRPNAWAMQTDDGADGPLFAAIDEVTREVADEAVAWGPTARVDFYPAARTAHALIRTGETAPYACFLLAKGIVAEMKGTAS